MAELTLVRWKRYGKDRLYVNTSDGTRVGWLDLHSGETTVELDELREAFDAAVAQHRPSGTSAPTPAAQELEQASSELVPAAPTPRVSRPPTAEPEVAPEVPWTDYALNRAGEAARARALAEKEAAPVRTLAARLLRVHTDERAWRIGADGEEKVAAQLARLPEPWRSVHAIPIGDRGSDIDHVAIGPAGVYSINSKHHPDARIWVRGDTFKIDGRNQPYVRNARYEAKRVSAILSRATGIPLMTTGVVAVVGARGGFDVKSQPTDGAVVVLGRRDLRRWLQRRAPILTDEQVEILFEAARRSTTWSPA